MASTDGLQLGKRKPYIYTADDGTKYACLLFEDLGGVTDLGFEAYVAASKDVNQSPKGLKMRSVYGEDSNGVKKRIPVGKTSANGWKPATKTVTIQNVAYTLGTKIGEKLRMIKPGT